MAKTFNCPVCRMPALTAESITLPINLGRRIADDDGQAHFGLYDVAARSVPICTTCIDSILETMRTRYSNAR